MSQLQNPQILLKMYVAYYSKISACFGYTVFYFAAALCSLKKSIVSSFFRICKSVPGLSLVLFILIPMLGPVSVKGQPNPFQDDAKVPWHIVADEMNYDDQGKVYIGRGNVVITKKDKNLNADYVRFNQNTMDVFA